MYEGVRYFESRPGRGKFVKLLALQPDKRFTVSTTQQQVFKVGTRVEFGKPKEYGVIKWMGTIDDSEEEYVKVETVSCICYCNAHTHMRALAHTHTHTHTQTHTCTHTHTHTHTHRHTHTHARTHVYICTYIFKEIFKVNDISRNQILKVYKTTIVHVL